jgi:hypothetical protein
LPFHHGPEASRAARALSRFPLAKFACQPRQSFRICAVGPPPL